MDQLLEIKNLNIHYKKTIFQDGHVIFYDGNIHGITGPSGCGKTTLIKAILSQNNQCQCLYNNKEIRDDKDQFILDHVFYVDQYGGYFHNMNIYQHFQFYAELMNETVNVSKVHSFLNKVGLDKISVKHSPSRLSIGERKRFLIALALFSQREIIILDEPTASLDKKNITLLKDLLLSLKEKTVIFTTHESDLLDICDIVYEIDHFQIYEKKLNIQQKISTITEKNNRFHVTQYLKYKSRYQWLQQFFLVMIGIFLCVELGMVFNNEYTLFQGLTGHQYLANDQMIYFRKKQKNAQNNMYITGEEFNSVPLSEKEKQNIENIPGIVSLRKIGTLSVVNPNNTVESHEITIINNHQENVVNQENVMAMRPVVRPYYPENNMDNENQKIFITEQFALEYNVSEGDSIKMPLYIPTYQYVSSSESQMYRYISYTHIEMTFTINNIITSEEAYKSFDTPYVIYVPYQKFETIINDYNGEISNDKPRSSEVKGMPYSYDDYVIFTNKESIANVYKSLIEMDDDYDVFSQSVYYTEGAQEEIQLQKTKLLMIGGIGTISIIAYLVIYYFQFKSKKGEREQLLWNGVNSHHVKTYQWIETLIRMGMWVLLSMIVMIVGRTSYIWINLILFTSIACVLGGIELIVTHLTIHKEKIC